VENVREKLCHLPTFSENVLYQGIYTLLNMKNSTQIENISCYTTRSIQHSASEKLTIAQLVKKFRFL